MHRLLLSLLAVAALPASIFGQVQMRPLPGDREVPVARAQIVPPRAQPVPPRAVAAPAIPLPQSGGSDQTFATLRAGDSFEMRLSGMESPYGDEFMRQYLVDGDGSVNFPYIGSVRAAGYTPGQLERVIQQRLVAEKIFTNPTATINLQTTARVVSVTGGVRQPQRLQWTSDLTLRTAVDLAGGLSDFGKPKGVRLLRNGRVIGTYDLRALQKDPAADPKILPGDVVDVPQ